MDEETGSGGFVFHPIGEFKSCYRGRCGTPRQGGIVPESLAVLQCSRDLNPVAALEGFQAFSHCWVLYIFHKNTNLQREGRTVAKRKQTRGRVPLWQGLCMKVAPPRCPELRVGVLACRTPHRPNPVGLSLARIVRVDAVAGEVVLAGLDVVDGTPCLDLKPYLPTFEAIPSAVIPPWVQASYEEALMTVAWSPEASAQLSVLLQGLAADEGKAGVISRGGEEGKAVETRRVRLWPFASEQELRSALEGTLALDIRSPLQKVRHQNPGPQVDGCHLTKEPFFVGDLWFHELHVTYALLPESCNGSDKASASVRIERVEARPPDAGDRNSPAVGQAEALA